MRAVQALVPVQARDTALRFPADMGVARITSQCPADIQGRVYEYISLSTFMSRVTEEEYISLTNNTSPLNSSLKLVVIV